MNNINLLFMKEAIKEAEKAMAYGEIPVGAIIVKNNRIIGRGHNLRTITGSPLDHAEIVAMKSAAKTIGNWRLDNCTMYVTLEPCVMCAGAAVQCRLSTIIYGASDPKGGAVGSLYDIPRDSRMYHTCNVQGGIMKEYCANLLYKFFREKRLHK